MKSINHTTCWYQTRISVNADIFVEINDVEMRPLDEYMGFAKKEPDLVLDVEKVDGIKLGNCAAFSSFSVFPPKSGGETDDDMSPVGKIYRNYLHRFIYFMALLNSPSFDSFIPAAPTGVPLCPRSSP